MSGPVSEGPPSFALRARHWLRTYRFPLSSLILAVAVVMVILALGDFTPLNTLYPFSVINGYTDQSGNGGENWNLLFVILGPILVIIGGYLVGVYLVARRRFEQLMRSKSKAELLRNISELEELLWDLTPDHQRRYDRKCAELHIRR